MHGHLAALSFSITPALQPQIAEKRRSAERRILTSVNIVHRLESQTLNVHYFANQASKLLLVAVADDVRTD